MTIMANATENNKRIAKNTLLLYVRMLVMMAVTLYTSRVVLAALGVEDFGIYNVVGGVVSMFSVLSGSFTTSISRFLTFEIGKGDSERLNAVFSAGLNIQIGMSVLIAIIAETVGLWFLTAQMNIPQDRIWAANLVFQCSIATFILNLISTPYNAAIIAHEKMSAFAYLSVIDALLKLGVAFAVAKSPFDHLNTYCILILAAAILIRIVYMRYSKNHFSECRQKISWNKSVIKEMTGFAGWNLLGNGAYLLNTQGANILTNIFFNVAVNAARGIATQVDNALKMFVNSFTTAVNPMITKSYAQGDFEYMHKLVCASSKLSAYLMAFIAIPIFFEAETILTIWLGTVPPYTNTFLRWVMLSSFVDTVLANSLVTSMFATGKIKRYQIIVTSVGGLVFPLSWLAFKLGLEPYYCYVIYFVIYSILLFVRLKLLEGMIKLRIITYVRNVLCKVIPILMICSIPPVVMSMALAPGWVRLLLVTITNTILASAIIYAIGLTNGEQRFIKDRLRKTICNFSRR